MWQLRTSSLSWHEWLASKTLQNFHTDCPSYRSNPQAGWRILAFDFIAVFRGLQRPSARGCFSDFPIWSTRRTNRCGATSTTLWTRRNRFCWSLRRDGNSHGRACQPPRQFSSVQFSPLTDSVVEGTWESIQERSS